MGPEGSLPGSQNPTTGSYTERDAASPHSINISLRQILILSLYLRLDLPSCLFPADFSTKILCAINFHFPHAF